MLKYVDPTRKWLYIKSHLHPDEINYSTIAIDNTIELDIEWFVKNWRRVNFYELIYGLTDRFTSIQVHKFIAENIPVKILFDNINYITFGYTCSRVKSKVYYYIKDIKLPLKPEQIPDHYSEFVPIVLELRNNGNFDDAVIRKVDKLLKEKSESKKEIINKKGESKCKTFKPLGLKNTVQKKLTSSYSQMKQFIAQLTNGINKAQ